jgi:hypothetical protein
MPIVLGLLMISFGLFINITPRFYDLIGGTYFDFTGLNLPVGIIMIVAGAVLLWKFLREAS